VAKLTDVEGIGPAYAEQLQAAGIATTEALLDGCADPAGRKEAAARTGISESLILAWVNRVDLFRVKGVGEEYADLLEAAGVDTVVELAQRNADNLHAALVAANDAKRLVRQVPAQSQVAAWIETAKTLPRVVTY
jgi:predicted flap endonuclease-1-like 5' DNA nuclease